MTSDGHDITWRSPGEDIHKLFAVEADDRRCGASHESVVLTAHNGCVTAPDAYVVIPSSHTGQSDWRVLIQADSSA